MQPETTLPTGTVTFMFTDIEGSSRMWEADQRAAREALGIHDALIIEGVENTGGFIVKSRGEGDSHFAVFTNAADALKAAVAIQRALAAHSWPTAKPLRVRMALHTGDAELRLGDYYGRTVNRAARLRAIGHGGQILVSQATAELARERLPEDVLLRDLGRHKLKDLSRPEQVFQVDIAGLQSDFPPLKSLNLLTHNLPAQSTSFIGRDQDVANVITLLDKDNVRLITLSGPGGTGKTRLSLEVGHEQLGRFAGGVFFIPLAEATSTELVISKTARELEVREGGSLLLLHTLKNYLRDKEMMLLLDNFEQVAEAAGFVAELLDAAPGLKVIVTSRTLLNLRAEHNYPVPMLTLPSTNQPITLAGLQETEATTLFIERATAANPRLMITDENAPLVAEICYRLDGLPLAIELASARVRMLSLDALLDRLTHRLKLLTGGARDLPQRQQTLRKAIDWSYDLLAQEERKLLARLSVFVGGFTLEAAEAVCGAEGDLDVFSGVELLLNNSLLVQQELENGTLRFNMLEAIREYAAERLTESGELELMLSRHSQYYAQQLQENSFASFSADALAALNWMDREHDNLRAVLNNCLQTAEGRTIAPHLALGLSWFWYRRGFVTEGREWSERILAAVAGEDRSLGKAEALGSAAAMAMWQGDLNTAYTYGEEALAIAGWLEDPFNLAFSMMTFAIVHINSGKDALARNFLLECLPIYSQMGHTYFESLTLVHLANASLGLGDFAASTDYLDKAMAIGKDLHEGWLDSFALNNRGEVARAQGNYDEARGYYQESEKLLREMGDFGDLARLVHTLGYIAQHEGDLEMAESRFRESLAIFEKVGNQRGIAECLAGLAGLRAEQGNPQMAATLLAAAAATQDVTGAAWWPADRVEIERNARIIRAALDEETFAAAREAGRSLSLDQAVAFALAEG